MEETNVQQFNLDLKLDWTVELVNYIIFFYFFNVHSTNDIISFKLLFHVKCMKKIYMKRHRFEMGRLYP